jgi:hypothetical protein
MLAVLAKSELAKQEEGPHHQTHVHQASYDCCFDGCLCFLFVDDYWAY